MMSEFDDNPLTDLHDSMLSDSLAMKLMYDEISEEEDSNKIIDIINEFKISNNILPSQLREIRRDVFRNIASELASLYDRCPELIELHNIFTEYDLFPINIKIKNEDLYLDSIEHYLRIINSPLSDLIDDYEDITQIKSFLTKNKIKETDLVSMYQSYVNYSKYFKDCFDDIHKLEDKLIVMSLIKECSMMWDANQLSLSFNEDLGIENPFDFRRVEQNLLDCFNTQKINSYWGLSELESDYLDYDIFSLDTSLYTNKTKQEFNFEKLKPGFDIKENSVVAIWYLAIIHGILDGNFDETESMLLINTMKISVALVSKVNEKSEDINNSAADDWIQRDHELLMDYRTNKLSSISKIQLSELWEAYHCAADKITNPELHAFAIAICVWISQGDLSETQNQGIGKLSFRWNQFDNDSIMFWLDEINAYATGEKG
jgi:hypothetical protein